MRVLRRHNEIVRDALRQFGGSEVKHTGDGVMASFGDPQRALQAAVQIQDRVRSTGSDDSPDRLMVRIGLSAGEPIQEGADLFGVSVNMASRLCDAAGPGEVYLAQELIDALESHAVEIESLGLLALKGFDEPVPVSRVAR
ncbi:MAG: adenylate/guanylate cyclase domain-containing protein [Chloroflexi bacterium]|nr:adenylate/guanylate cyclase domain-containing protein [Chloroflexota bacterium]